MLFLEGSNFLTEDIKVTRPDGRVVTLEYNSGMLNRIDLKLFIYGFLDFADSRIMKFCVSTEDTNYSMTSFLLDS